MNNELANLLPRTPDPALVWSIGYSSPEDVFEGPYTIALVSRDLETSEPIGSLSLYSIEDFDSFEPPIDMIVRSAFIVLESYAQAFCPESRPYSPLAGFYEGSASPTVKALEPITPKVNKVKKRSWWPR